MSTRRKHHPARWVIAQTVYWAIFGPLVVVCTPFLLLNALVGWLHWKAFPFFADVFQPATYWIQKSAVTLGNAVLGFTPDTAE